MSISGRVMLLLMHCSVVVVFMTESLCLGQSVPIVIDAWRGQQKKFEAIRFRISGVHSEPQGYVKVPEGFRPRAPVVEIPPKNTERPIVSDVLLNLFRRQLRCRVQTTSNFWDSNEKQFVSIPRDETSYFNGEQSKNYQPHAANLANAPYAAFGTELFVFKSRSAKIVFGLEHNPLLYACGIIHTTLHFDPANLSPELLASDFRMEGAVELDGKPCQVLRTVPDASMRFFEFWVDAEDPCIIRQVHGYGLNQEGKLWVTTTVDWQETEHGPLPSTWEIHRFEDSTDKVAVYKMKLDEFEVNPVVSDADFDIDPPAGTLVYDETLPRDAHEYVVAKPGEPNLPIGEHLLQEEQTRSRSWLMVSLAIVLVLLVSAILVYRRREA